MPSQLIHAHMRMEHLPHIWCAGCSHGILMRDVAVAIERCGLKPEQVVIVSGIGCSSRAAGYMNYCTVHTTHGRAIPFATGIKMARPDLKVIVITGDGDATAIGGNHFIHACRRNIDLTAIVFNNSIYGMTGGQYSPTTPTGEFGTTAPYGNIDMDFDIPEIARASGATFTARGTAYHVRQTVDLIARAIAHEGFSVVDCASVCPTYYGRKNHKGDAVQMLAWQRDHFVDVGRAAKMDAEALRDKRVFGLLFEKERPEYTRQYETIIERAGGRAK